MLDTILIGMSGLDGYSRGLRVIANNTSNLNTPGFKKSMLDFTDMFYAGHGAGRERGQLGNGLSATHTTLSFAPGDMRQTGGDLDVAIDGLGLFTLRDANGELSYTRAGQFEFNSNGVLVDRRSGLRVVGLDADGKETDISITGLKSNDAKKTTTVKFQGNLSSAATTETIGGVTVYDNVGGKHVLSVRLTNTNGTTPGSWKVDLMDGPTLVDTGQIVFENGKPKAGKSKVSMVYSSSGIESIPLELDFDSDVTSSTNATSLSMSSQNGYGLGSLTKTSFDSAGALNLTYSNGQTVKGPKLALAYFDHADAIEAIGGGRFRAVDPTAWHVGTAGQGPLGATNAGTVELSNVDLSQEFGELIIMQRGYQASSQVVSTANEMLQELFAMKGK